MGMRCERAGDDEEIEMFLLWEIPAALAAKEQSKDATEGEQSSGDSQIEDIPSGSEASSASLFGGGNELDDAGDEAEKPGEWHPRWDPVAALLRVLRMTMGQW